MTIELTSNKDQCATSCNDGASHVWNMIARMVFQMVADRKFHAMTIGILRDGRDRTRRVQDNSFRRLRRVELLKDKELGLNKIKFDAVNTQGLFADSKVC